MGSNLDETTDKDLNVNVLSSKSSYLAWATFYSLVHLGICYYLYVVKPAIFSDAYTLAVIALLVGPFFYFLDLYLRQIFWPYWWKMRQRGGLPPRAMRKHPYDFEIKVGGLVLFAALSGIVTAMVFIWFEEYSHLRAWGGAVVMSVVGAPFVCIGFYQTYFVWEGHPDA